MLKPSRVDGQRSTSKQRSAKVGKLMQANDHNSTHDRLSGDNGEGLVVIINGDAGFVRKRGPHALRFLIRRHAPSDLRRVITTDRHDLRECLRDVALQTPRAVAVIGGDGTAHAAIEALSPLGVPSIPLPGGTMNRLAARVFGRASLQ